MARFLHRERLEALAATTLAFTAAAFFLHQVARVGWPVVDDAAISAAFARTALAGAGFRATPLSQPVEAFSNPLWTLLLMLSGPLRLPIIDFARNASVALAALAVVLLGAWPALGQTRLPRLEDAVAPWLLATFPAFAGWAGSGMELGLYAFLYVCSGIAAVRAWKGGSPAWMGLSLGLLCLTRPEALLFAVLVLGCFTLSRPRQQGAPAWRAVGVAIAGLALPLGAWLVFRWFYFADFLPNSFWAKQTWEFGPLPYLAGFVGQYPVLVGLAALASLLGALLAAPRGARARLLHAGLFIAVELFFTWRARGDWMGEWRFLQPVVPALCIGVGGAVEALRARCTGPLRSHAAVAMGVVTLLAALAGWLDLQQTPRVHASPQLPYAFVASHSRSLRHWVNATGEQRPRLALPDLGGLALEYRDAEIVDVAGLADYALAHHSGNPAAQEDYLVSEGIPSLVDIHGPSGGLLTFATLMRHLRPLTPPLYTVAGLDLTHDPRCPGGKALVLGLSPAQLLLALRRDMEQADGGVAILRWQCAAAYQSPTFLPSAEERLVLAADAEEAARQSDRAGQLKRALRLASLATILSDGDAHRRRYTEILRSRVFPPRGPHP